MTWLRNSVMGLRLIQKAVAACAWCSSSRLL